MKGSESSGSDDKDETYCDLSDPSHDDDGSESGSDDKDETYCDLSDSSHDDDHDHDKMFKKKSIVKHSVKVSVVPSGKSCFLSFLVIDKKLTRI